jgi:hypothetical protein
MIPNRAIVGEAERLGNSRDKITLLHDIVLKAVVALGIA